MKAIRTGLRWVRRIMEFAAMLCIAGFLCATLILNVVSIPGLP